MKLYGNIHSEKKGFTLVELIVVVAILGILAFLVIPKIAGFTAKAEAATCASNRQTYYSQFLSEEIENSQTPTSEVWNKVVSKLGKGCPSKQAYELLKTASGGYVVYCPVHQDVLIGTVPKQITDLLLDIKTNPQNYGFKPTAWQLESNAQLEQVIFKTNGDKWPSLQIGEKLLNIMPYYEASSKTHIIYAQASSTKGYWVSCIYNQRKNCWYVAPDGKGYSIVGISADKVYDYIENEKFKWSVQTNVREIPL